MGQLILFVSFLISSFLTIELALALLGCKKRVKQVLQVTVLNGSFDYLVMQIILPSLKLHNGLNIITGLTFLAFTCRYILKLNKIGSISVSFLSYIISALGELLLMIFLVNITGAKIISNDVMLRYFPVYVIILILPLIFLKKRKIQIIKLSVEEKV